MELQANVLQPQSGRPNMPQERKEKSLFSYENPGLTAWRNAKAVPNHLVRKDVR